MTPKTPVTLEFFERILTKTVERMAKTREERVKAVRDDLNPRIESAEVAIREARVSAAESAERTAERVAQDYVAGPLGDARADAEELLADARSRVAEYCDLTIETLTDFDKAWVDVHRCYSTLVTDKKSLKATCEKLFPDDDERPRVHCCRAMSHHLSEALRPVLELGADAHLGLRQHGREGFDCQPPPAEFRTVRIAQQALADARIAIDRLSRMSDHTDERIRLQTVFEGMLNQIEEFGGGCDAARRYGTLVIESLGNGAIPIASIAPCTESFEKVKGDSKANFDLLKELLANYALASEGISR